MSTNKDDIQDDYYANISQNSENTAWDKKTLKIKPKVVVKKPSDWSGATTEHIVHKPKIIPRKVEITESVETAMKYANNLVTIDVPGQEEKIYSQNYACTDCGISFEELTPRMFSFNNPFGACPECTNEWDKRLK